MALPVLRCETFGDQNILVTLADAAGLEATGRVAAFCRLLELQLPPGVIEWVPGYTTVAVTYRPWEVTHESLKASLITLAGKIGHVRLGKARHFKIPVCYGGQFGPDLEDVAHIHGLSTIEVVRLHTQSEYTVAMIGFVPGFPYLLGLPAQLVTPRLDQPRVQVPRGAVAIGGEQTGIYPLSTPGGWRLIGRTPVPLYDPHSDPPVLLQSGDRVRFRAVKENEYLRIEREMETDDRSWKS